MPGLLQNKELEGAGIVWLETLRRKGREAFAAAGLPTPKTEAWKYTRLRMLGADDFVLPGVHAAAKKGIANMKTVPVVRNIHFLLMYWAFVTASSARPIRSFPKAWRL